VPGYKGKRLSVDYDMMFMPALNQENANFKTGVTNFNVRQYLGLEYVVAPSGSVGINFGMFKTSAYPQVNHTRSSSYYYSDEEPEAMKISANTIGIYYKFFKLKKKGFIAPIGNYSKLGFQMVIGKGKFLTYDDVDKAKFESSFTQCFLTYGWGKQFMIYKGLMGKFGIDLGIPMPPKLGTGDDRISRLTLMYLVNFETGLSFIIK
jgi:hypothetical protein